MREYLPAASNSERAVHANLLRKAQELGASEAVSFILPPKFPGGNRF